MKEASGKIGQVLTGLDKTDKDLVRTDAKLGEANRKLGVIDQAIQKIPLIRQ